MNRARVTDFQELLIKLDQALTGKSRNTTVTTACVQRFAPADFKERAYALSDSQSRLAYNMEDKRLYLKDGARALAQQRWEDVRPTINHIEIDIGDALGFGQGAGRTYGYIRASTARQVESPEIQRGIITTYCQRMGRTIDGIFVDPASSGDLDIMKRPAGREMMRLVRSGDHVVVARLDRISRSFVNFAKIIEAWDRLKVVIHLCDLPGGVIDPTNPYSRLLTSILVLFAEHERRMIVTRLTEGKHASRIKNGIRFPATPPYGLQWQKQANGRYELVADERELVVAKRIYEMYSEGYNPRQISDHLRDSGVKSRDGKPYCSRRVYQLVNTAIKLQETAKNGKVEAEADREP